MAYYSTLFQLVQKNRSKQEAKKIERKEDTATSRYTKY